MEYTIENVGKGDIIKTNDDSYLSITEVKKIADNHYEIHCIDEDDENEDGDCEAYIVIYKDDKFFTSGDYPREKRHVRIYKQIIYKK